MSLVDSFKKVYRQGREADPSTPEGMRALDNDIETLFRLLLTQKIGAEYLQDGLKATLGDQNFQRTIEPRKMEYSSVLPRRRIEWSTEIAPERMVYSATLEDVVG